MINLPVYIGGFLMINLPSLVYTVGFLMINLRCVLHYPRVEPTGHAIWVPCSGNGRTENWAWYAKCSELRISDTVNGGGLGCCLLKRWRLALNWSIDRIG